MKETKEYFLADTMFNYLVKAWNFLNGKKTYFAMALLFVYGGLVALGLDFPLLKEAALLIGGVGLAHGLVKKFQ